MAADEPLSAPTPRGRDGRAPDPLRVGGWSSMRMFRDDDAVDFVIVGTGAGGDFVAHMAPHHQGAIDMAQVELKYGKDPTLRQLASRIVAAQRDEIALMERWQKERGKAP
ncbi:UNVERIFIED_ORG: uncharacterized protein (DUF305 family) [Burkholderia territorii]